MKMNSLLSRSVAIKEIFEVPREAHARFDATVRKYHYFIHIHKNPFKRLYSFEYLYHALNYEMMQKVATKLLDFNEFLPLIKLDKEHKKTKCTLYTSELIQLSETEWRYEVSANRFLHNMVRRIVGTMLLVGRDKLSFDEFVESMEAQTEMKYIQLAPSNGLHLVDITYPFLSEKQTEILL
jgi:tRNA pseudouridine38-40 synthase